MAATTAAAAAAELARVALGTVTVHGPPLRRASLFPRSPAGDVRIARRVGGWWRALPSEGRGLNCGGGEAGSDFAKDRDDADNDDGDDVDNDDNDVFDDDDDDGCCSRRGGVPAPPEEEGVELAPDEEEAVERGGWDPAMRSPSTLL